jgi:hypothetical protein
MRASFFEVDVCSLTKMERQLNPAEKGERRGGPVGVPRDRLHRVTRDSCAGAACAGPKAHVCSQATRAKPALDDKSELERPGRRRGAGVLLLIVALGASWIPARHAASVEPMDALRGIDHSASCAVVPSRRRRVIMRCSQPRLLKPERGRPLGPRHRGQSNGQYPSASGVKSSVQRLVCDSDVRHDR